MAHASFRLRSLAAALALASAGGALFAAQSVIAQQNDLPLRGDLRAQPSGDLLSRPSTAAEPASRATQGRDDGGSTYRPFNDGAISLGEPLAGARPVAPDAGSLADEAFGGVTPDDRTGRAQRVGPQNRTGSPNGAIAGDVDAILTATVPLAARDTRDLERNLRIGSDASRVNAVETGRRVSSDTPFAPLGMRVGTLLLFPSIEQGLGWTSNANGSVDAEGSFFSETAARFDLRSDWSRHQARLNGFGILRRDLSGAEIRESEAGLDGELGLDLADGTQGRAAISYLHRPESASSPVTPVFGASRPDRQTLAGELGIGREVARLRLGLTANVTRDMYSDVTLADGTRLSQDDRNSTLASVRVRTGYAISPALIPFIEAELGRRFYDNDVDEAGFARAADRMALRGGIALDINEKWTGEAFLGWLSEAPDDDDLSEISGLEIGGNLAWSPLRGTIVDLNALTSIESATTECDCGSLLYAANLSVTRDLLWNLTGTAGLGVDYRNYASSSDYDLTWSGQVALTYWFNRYLGLTGRGRYEVATSTDADRETETTSVFVGLRVQR